MRTHVYVRVYIYISRCLYIYVYTYIHNTYTYTYTRARARMYTLFIELVILHVVRSPARTFAYASCYTHTCICVELFYVRLHYVVRHPAEFSSAAFLAYSCEFVSLFVCLVVSLPSLYVHRCISYLIVTLNSSCYTVIEISTLSLLLYLPATRLFYVARVRGVEIVESRATILFYILPAVLIRSSFFFSQIFCANNYIG